MTALPLVSTGTNTYWSVPSVWFTPPSVKRGIVQCLYDRAERLVTKPSVIAGEKKHLPFVLVSNGYPYSFLSKKRARGRVKSTAIQGVSKPLCICLEQQRIRTVFKSDRALRSHRGHRQLSEAGCSSLQDSLRVRQILHRGNGETRMQERIK